MENFLKNTLLSFHVKHLIFILTKQSSLYTFFLQNNFTAFLCYFSPTFHVKHDLYFFHFLFIHIFYFSYFLFHVKQKIFINLFLYYLYFMFHVKHYNLFTFVEKSVHLVENFLKLILYCFTWNVVFSSL